MRRAAVAPGWLPGRIRQVIAGLLVLGVGGFLIDGANRPANPYLEPAAAPAAAAAPLRLPAVTLSVSAPGGSKRSACTLEASTTAEQQKGLMGRRSLGGYAGMSFVFARPSTVMFYMKDTLIALSVAWFDPAGRYIASATMPPCPPATRCPTYAAGRAFSLAVEVPAGGLAALGIGPGSTASLGGVCGP